MKDAFQIGGGFVITISDARNQLGPYYSYHPTLLFIS